MSIFLISNHNSFRVMLDKIASVYFIWKILALSLEMASPGNQHCVNCIGTLSFRHSYIRHAWTNGWCRNFLITVTDLHVNFSQRSRPIVVEVRYVYIFLRAWKLVDLYTTSQ